MQPVTLVCSLDVPRQLFVDMDSVGTRRSVIYLKSSLMKGGKKLLGKRKDHKVKAQPNHVTTK